MNYRSMLSKTITILLILLFANSISAQILKNDVVYLKNGSVIKGEIVEIKADEYVKIKSLCDNIWVFKNSEIDKILKEERKAISDSIKTPIFTEYGTYTNFSLGFLYGIANENVNPPLSVLIGGGYNFKNNMSVGLLTGVELLDNAFLPAMVNFRYSFVNTKISHFVFFQSGYSFVLDDTDDNIYMYNNDEKQNYGGIVINPGFGLKWNLNQDNALAVSIGYRYQQNKYSYNDYNGQEINRTVKYNRISVSFGYYFN
ncbi:MAG: hypothetical protein U9R54_07365 [Bacteroidota bacterium]|nr:hypothetical protein [Bacteroidota bacterium]